MFRIPVNLRQKAFLDNGHITEELGAEIMGRVCDKHFVSGWPSDDPSDVDYLPTLLMKGEANHKKSHDDTTPRNNRASKRTEKRYLREVAEVLCSIIC
jgi:hypothetical protein